MSRAEFLSDWSDTSDPYEVGAPYLTLAEETIPGNSIRLVGEHLCLLPADSLGHDIRIVETATDKVYTLPADGTDLRPASYDDDKVLQARGTPEGDPDGRARTPFDYDQIRVQGPGSGYKWEIYQPYAWQRIDVAQLIWTLTRFYCGPDGEDLADLLDQESFLAAHEWWEPKYRRVAVCYYRRVEARLLDDMVDLARSAGACLAFSLGGDAVNDGAVRLRIFPHQVTSAHSITIDVEDPRMGVIGDPKLRTMSEALVNRQTRVPGPYVVTDGVDNYTTLVGGFRSQDDRNVARQEDADSVATYGLIAAGEIAAPWVPNRDHALNAFDLWREGQPRREYTVSLGPRVFGVTTGDRVAVHDVVRGLSGEEFVVVAQEIDLDTMTGTLVMREIVPPKMLTAERIPDRLFTLDARDLTGFSADDPVTEWDDSYTGDPVATRLLRGAGVSLDCRPLYKLESGVPYLEFTGVRAMDLSGVTWDFAQTERRVAGLTCVAVVRKEPGDEIDRVLIDIQDDLELLLTTDDDSGPAIRRSVYDIQELATPLGSSWQIWAFRCGSGGEAGGVFNTPRAHCLVWTPSVSSDPVAAIDDGYGFFDSLNAPAATLGANAAGTSGFLEADLRWVSFFERDLSWPELRALANHLIEEFDL